MVEIIWEFGVDAWSLPGKIGQTAKENECVRESTGPNLPRVNERLTRQRAHLYQLYCESTNSPSLDGICYNIGKYSARGSR